MSPIYAGTGEKFFFIPNLILLLVLGPVEKIIYTNSHSYTHTPLYCQAQHQLQLSLTQLGLSLVFILVPPAPTHPLGQTSSEMESQASKARNK